MFMRKKPFSSSSTSGSKTAMETTQEPSSPKVTCIGQVRVRRSKPKAHRRHPGGTSVDAKSTTNRCYCVRKPMFCDSIHVKLKRPRSFRPSWRKWAFFFRCRNSVKVRSRTESSKTDSGRVHQIGGINYADYLDDDEEEEEEDGEESEIRDFKEERSRCSDDGGGGGYASASTTPPKNALLLTRCRSAPYRSSSLAGQFWGSPLKGEEEEGRRKSTSQEDGVRRRNSTSTAEREATTTTTRISSSVTEREATTSTRNSSSTIEPEADIENTRMERNEAGNGLENEPCRRDSTAESRGGRESDEEVEDKHNVGICEGIQEEVTLVEVQEVGRSRGGVGVGAGSRSEKMEYGQETRGRASIEEVKVNVSELRKKFENGVIEVADGNSCLELRRNSGDFVKLRSVVDDGNVDDDGGVNSTMNPPLLMLKRCKSAPTRRGLERFNPAESSKVWNCC